MIYEIIIILLIAIVLYLWFKNREWKLKFEQRVEEFLKQEEEKIRRDAIERSARSLSGKALEKFVPFLERFPYDAHDVRWLGDPVDLIIFDGYSRGNPKKVVFCEVKSRESKLSKKQNAIKKIVEGRAVEWDEFRVD